MKLIYIDESGNTGTRIDDLAQPYHLLSALVVDEMDIRSIENDVRMLGFKYFGADSQNTDFEFHGYEVHKGKGRYFSKIKIEKRIDIMDDLLNLIRQYNLQIIYSLVDKVRNKISLHPHQLCFLLLVNKIEDYLAKKNSLGLLVADENHDISQRLIDDLERFKTILLRTNETGFGEQAIKAERIVDSIHFVKSKNNHIIQLADVVAYVFLRGQKTCEELQLRMDCSRAEFLLQNWSELQASPKQKTELKHFSMLQFQPFIGMRYPDEKKANQGFTNSGSVTQTLSWLAVQKVS
jgi:hypothetical protein